MIALSTTTTAPGADSPMTADAQTPPSRPDTPAGRAMRELLSRHRSIRHFRPDPIDGAWLDELCAAAIAGTSSSGNLNMFAIVRTQDEARRRALWALHSEQDMILEAPVLLTFCADTRRTRAWLAQRDARPGFGDFMSYHVSAFDAMILSQTVALTLEAHGLGICYLGTTVESMRAIGELLDLPDHCVPVTTLVVGHPAESPAARDRLDVRAYVHEEVYTPHDAAAIDALYGERERKGWARYRAMGPEMIERMEQAGITSLAQFYTSKLKYDPDAFVGISEHLEKLLVEKGFRG